MDKQVAKIIKQRKPHKNTYPIKASGGDILYGGPYLRDVDVAPMIGSRLFLPVHCNLNTLSAWANLEKFGIEHEQFKQDVTYDCPLIGTAYSVVPGYILTHDIEPYVMAGMMGRLYEGDVDFVRDTFCVDANDLDTLLQVPELVVLQMGSGYTFGTLPTDGSRGKDVAVVDLDNGDMLFSWYWKWYNK
jgi:hypothetical protein